QEGQPLAADSLAAELKSLGDAWQSFSGQPLSQDQLSEVLNRPTTRCATQTVDGQVQLEVLSWGTLAAFHQRHICHSIVNTHDFFKDALGVPEDAKEFRQFVEQLFAQIRLFPVVQTMLAANSPATAETFAKAAVFAWQHPERMTAAAWVGLSVKTPEGSRTPVPSEAATWFS